MYKTEKSFDVIKGVVPDFSLKNDVNIIALKINGETTNTVPQKGNYGDIIVECDNDAIGEWDTERWGLFVSSLKKSPTTCSINFIIKEGTEWTFDYTGSEQSFTVPLQGKYKIELWGAEGGKSLYQGVSYNDGGNGAYTKGEISLQKEQTLYLYVGGAGANASKRVESLGGYNGGGNGVPDKADDESSGGGGGATDIRLVNGLWDSFASLKSRIMVAAGGGGASWSYAPGAGGGLSADLVGTKSAINQTTGYAFGKGQSGVGDGQCAGSGSVGNGDCGVAGAGGGYYGGRSEGITNATSASGGSSFISGYEGCNAIKQESVENNIQHTGDSIHYSGLVFTNTEMKSGKEVMPKHDGTQNTMVGNSGNGYARITYLGK